MPAIAAVTTVRRSATACRGLTEALNFHHSCHMSNIVGITDLLTAGAAAKIIGVAEVTVQRWAKSGRIKAGKLPGRTGAYLIARAEVERAAAERAARKAAA